MKFAVPARLLESLHVAAGRPRFLEAIERNPKQAAFVRDPAKRKTALCGRRGGKTTGIAGWLYGGMVEKPGTRQVYVGLSRGTARQILWDGIMLPMVKEYGLPLRETTRDGHLIIQHSNGSSLWIAGCDDKREVGKFRGQKYFRVNIDEAQEFPDEVLEHLVERAIGPALSDFNGQLALTGTPSAIDIGYFHECTTGLKPGWSHEHHWTVLDNPYFLTQPADDSQFANRAEETLAQERARFGNNAEHPTYLREMLGRWVNDIGALVYPFTYEKNSWTPQNDENYGLPPGEYVFGLGVDLGYSERSLAFTLAAVVRGTGKVYLLRSYTRDRMVPTRLAAYIQDLRAKVLETTGCGLRVVVDEGGLGGGFTGQMQLMGVSCEAAEKSEKRAYQEYVGGLILTGGVQAHFGACAELLDESRRLQFDPDTGKEEERFRRHCCFIAGTKVATPAGKLAIERLGVGDLVITRRGPCRVIDAKCTGIEAIWELRTMGGRTIRATGNHPIWSGNHWQSLDSLVHGDRLSLCAKPLNSTAEPIADTQMRPVEKCASIGPLAMAIGCIEQFGKKLMGRFRAAITSTTKTVTRSTICSTTWNASAPAHTSPITYASECRQIQSIGARTLLEPKRLPRHGTLLPPAASGTPQIVDKPGQKGQKSSISALFAEVNSAHAHPGQKSARVDAKPELFDSVLSVRPLGFSAPVYNLTVESEHEYFANDILVSNCDSMLYIVRALFPRYDPEHTQPEPGTPEWHTLQMKLERAKIIKEQAKKKR